MGDTGGLPAARPSARAALAPPPRLELGRRTCAGWGAGGLLPSARARWASCLRASCERRGATAAVGEAAAEVLAGRGMRLANDGDDTAAAAAAAGAGGGTAMRQLLSSLPAAAEGCAATARAGLVAAGLAATRAPEAEVAAGTAERASH